MSTEAVDPKLIEQTRQQIRGLVEEISRLTKAGLEPLAFHTEFLNRVVQALAAHGGAVWTTSDGRGLELVYQINLQSTGLLGDQAAQARHGRVLHQVLRGEGMIVAPHSGAGDDREAGNPTDFLLVLAPLKADQETRGVVEIFQRPGAPLGTQRGYLRFLTEMCDLAGDFLKTRQLRQFTDRQALWGQLETFARMVHSSLDSGETAFTIANEARRLIECDRVSVAIRRGRKCVVQAISGQDTFDKRSNTVTLLNRLSTAVVRTGEPMWYTGDTSDMPPQVEEAVQAYVDDSHSKTVAVLPLARTPDDADEDRQGRVEPIGALIVEQIENARPRDGMQQRIDVVALHSATALSNALDHSDLFLMPVWRALGKAKWIVSARTLPKTMAIALVVGCLLAAAFLVPADFELEGKGTLLPVNRRDVFAGEEGTVIKLPVEHGATVEQDQVVAELRNSALSVNLKKVTGDIQTSEQKVKSLKTLLLTGNLTREQKTQFAGDLSAEEENLKSLRQQLAILDEQMEELKVHSPITGQVITWDLRKRLEGRHINRGQVMMQVADPSGEWELEVQMPEDRMGHIASARRQLGDPLQVAYILATDPDTTRQGTVTEVHKSAEIRDENQNTVLLRVAINKHELEDLRPGATVTARVYCGRRAIGYVWFHDLIDWVNAKILFRL
ncbi:MAG: efflux RND transporter periplasmic adaptor subunit [Pirellulales bacterium]|nr:efflux RND transporter periplasmic adaptor subunit [Pirellulales bacterium]